jgi:hypothetical protein
VEGHTATKPVYKACRMTFFRKLINIDSGLRDTFKKLEGYFCINFDKETIDKIFNDAENDQVSEKRYPLFQAEKKFLRRQLIIVGTVDEYEPFDILIEIRNIREKELKDIKELVSG